MDQTNTKRRPNRKRQAAFLIVALMVVAIGIVAGFGVTQRSREEASVEAIHIGMTDQEVWALLYPGKKYSDDLHNQDSVVHGETLPASFPFAPSQLTLTFMRGRLERVTLAKPSFRETLGYWEFRVWQVFR